MANELPYFRFHVSAWQNGKIDIERFELKGLFISICGYYWMQDCSLTLAELGKKFGDDSIKMILELIELGIIKHEKRYDKVQIVFLNNQYDLLSENRKARQIAGSRGGNAKARLQQKRSYKDKDKDNIILDKDKDKKPDVLTDHKLSIFLNSNCPNIKKLKTQPTIFEFEKLEKEFGFKMVSDVFLSMENFKDLNKKYVSVYLTAKNWCDRRKPEIGNGAIIKHGEKLGDL